MAEFALRAHAGRDARAPICVLMRAGMPGSQLHVHAGRDARAPSYTFMRAGMPAPATRAWGQGCPRSQQDPALPGQDTQRDQARDYILPLTYTGH
jgi:hypothetical protein